LRPETTDNDAGAQAEKSKLAAVQETVRVPMLMLPQIAIVGSRSVGKSSLTVQFVDGHFVDSYYPTIENTFSKIIKYKNQDFATEIIDTAGQVRIIIFGLSPHMRHSLCPAPLHRIFPLPPDLRHGTLQH
jgi:hypothetical protein